VPTGPKLRPASLGKDIAPVPTLTAYAIFVPVVLVLLPVVSVPQALPDPPALGFVSALYDSRVSVEFVFQEVRVVAIERRAHAAEMPLWAVAPIMAGLCGNSNLALRLNGFAAPHVTRCTIAAAVSAFLAA
jgi:hypothetical protein